jgi:hypothetical protein
MALDPGLSLPPAGKALWLTIQIAWVRASTATGFSGVFLGQLQESQRELVPTPVQTRDELPSLLIGAASPARGHLIVLENRLVLLRRGRLVLAFAVGGCRQA